MHVLLVEDSKDLTTLFSRRFASEGWLTTAVESVPDALHELESDDFDVIVSDIGLPGLSGIDLIKTIRKNEDSKLRTMSVAVSAFSESEVDPIGNGFDAYIQKPVTPTELVARLKNVIGEAKV